MSRGGRNPMEKSRDLLRLAREQHGQVEREGELGQLRRLERERAQRNQRTAPLMAGPTFSTTASRAMDRNSRG